MKIVYQGKTKTGKEIIIRYPEIGDELKLWEYINKLSKEKTFVRLQGEEVSKEDEAKYLNNLLLKIKEHQCVHLLVFCGDELISASGIEMRDKTEKHLGIFGIAILNGFRGEGLGKLLMDLILKEAEKEISDLKIVTLEVYSTNSIAQSLYQKMGFVQYGLLPKGISRAGTFEDAILMYKNIR
jgi:ribosomal protein S18 acetylase RimI-like enzyme